MQLLVSHHVGLRKRVPGPRGLIALGSLLDVRRDRLGFLKHIVREHGDIVRFRMGPRDIYVVNQPRDIQHILQDNHENYRVGIGLVHARPFLGNGLLTSDGSTWLRQRRVVQLALHKSGTHTVFPLIVRGVQDMLDRWAGYVKRRESFDIFSEMQDVALKILGFTLFSVDLASHSPTIQGSMKVAIEESMRRMMALFPLPLAIPTPRNVRFCRAIDVLNVFTETLIDERRRSRSSFCDFLSMLTQATDGGSDAVLTDQEVRDQVMTILLAGQETTACALAWTWYLLSRRPDVERNVRAEVEQVLGDSQPSLDAVRKLEYTSMVVDESLRLYPPVWLIPRKSIHNDELGGYRIPGNADVLISPYLMHRHPLYWDNAEVFDPNRFLPERSVEHTPYTYIPFGAGRRFCIGAGLGKLEIQIVLALVTQRFRVSFSSTDPVEPEPLLALRPRGKIMASLREV